MLSGLFFPDYEGHEAPRAFVGFQPLLEKVSITSTHVCRRLVRRAEHQVDWQSPSASGGFAVIRFAVPRIYGRLEALSSSMAA